MASYDAETTRSKQSLGTEFVFRHVTSKNESLKVLRNYLFVNYQPLIVSREVRTRCGHDEGRDAMKRLPLPNNPKLLAVASSCP